MILFQEHIMLFGLIDQLVKTVHDLTNHPSVSTILKDAVATTEDVAAVVPEAATGNAGLVIDAIQAIASVFENASATPITTTATPAAAPVTIATPAAIAPTTDGVTGAGA